MFTNGTISTDLIGMIASHPGCFGFTISTPKASFWLSFEVEKILLIIIPGVITWAIIVNHDEVKYIIYEESMHYTSGTRPIHGVC